MARLMSPFGSREAQIRVHTAVHPQTFRSRYGGRDISLVSNESPQARNVAVGGCAVGRGRGRGFLASTGTVGAVVESLDPGAWAGRLSRLRSGLHPCCSPAHPSLASV